MARISWGTFGQRFYEAGIDRGVLYAPSQPGVPWNGLTSIEEAPTGGDAKPYYIDGTKYLNISAREEFEATLNAVSTPPEFDVCNGVSQVQIGLYAAQQPRKSFGLSYRTMIGNDQSDSVGYKIHLVYNALAAPSSRSNKSISDVADANAYSWKITTLPPPAAGIKPTAHFVIDSRYAIPFTLSALEDILYGSATNAPTLPTADQLVGLFGLSPMRAYLLSSGIYEIHQVDPANARAVYSPFHPVPPAPGDDPILWFDSSGGNYGIPKLVFGA